MDDNIEEPEEQVMILLGDDSKAMHFLLSNILKKFSCKLDSAMNGAEAVEKFKNNSYHLIFMDSHMPVMDGLTAIKEIRNIESTNSSDQTPIVMMSADDTPEDIEIGMNSGASHYLIKPITKESVTSTLQLFFDLDDSLLENELPKKEESPQSNENSEKSSVDSNDKNNIYIDAELKDLINGYLERKVKDIEILTDALSAKDFKTLQIKGHSIKGSGGGYGCDQLTTIGAEIEKAAKIQDSDTISIQIKEIKSFLDNVNIVIKTD